MARRTVTAVRSYPAEYAASGGSAEATAALVGDLGRYDPDPALAFATEGTTPGSTPRDLTGWLLLLALLTLPVDVGLRRLRLERGDLRRLVSREPRTVTDRSTGITAIADARREHRDGVRQGQAAGPDRPAARPAAPASRPQRDGPPPPAREDPTSPERDGPPPPPGDGGGASRLRDARRQARGDQT
jgi:hypothetical protein